MYLPRLTYWLDTDSLRLGHKGRRDRGPGSCIVLTSKSFWIIYARMYPVVER